MREGFFVLHICYGAMELMHVGEHGGKWCQGAIQDNEIF